MRTEFSLFGIIPVLIIFSDYGYFCYRLSQSSVKRLSVTRNFVEKYGQVEEVYGETSKSAPSDEPIEHHDLHPQIKVQFHGSETQETVAPKSPGPETEEEEISECKVECFFD